VRKRAEGQLMNNYRRGADFERRVCKYFEKTGHFVIRSAGSHGIIDLVAIKGGEVSLVQCKINGVLSKAARLQLVELRRETGCQVLLISRNVYKMVSEEIKEEN
jgi:Holliday junction resolvase